MIDPLRCFDRIVVEGLTVEPDRVMATYRVEGEFGAASHPLTFAYEGPVLDPRDPAIGNLAALMVAAPAVNYGLFADEVRLDLPLDAGDRSFLRAMLRNTATEIYINRFMQPNPFLRPPYRDLPFERRRGYSRAALTGPAALPARLRTRLAPERYAVMSSGGKESLLTFGLLEERGREVFPIFYNESGRHWFTALTAYRALRSRIPRTRRVWGDTDRLFSFLARHMKIIREDFQRIRADEYPVQLFTVELMVLATLPILYREGIGTILVGDEFDTTRRLSFRGVRHYGGLYDQSLPFDRAMTRFFARKGFGWCQLSVLRPLSELLVQRILGVRYPHLFSLQTSCHSAHLGQGRMTPCGECEKCRRVMGMILASGLDPRTIGYREEDVARLPGGLSQQPLHQEVAGAEHLRHLLTQRGVLPRRRRDSSGRLQAARPHPDVEHLRFTASRSPFVLVPRPLRGELMRIFLEHARGALRWENGRWQPFDPLVAERAVRGRGERRGAPLRSGVTAARATSRTR